MSNYVKFDEIPQSTRSTDNPPRVEKRYRSAGMFDSGAVKLQALSFVPLMVAHSSGAILIRDDVLVEEQGFRNYIVSVVWAEKSPDNSRNDPGGINWTFRFTTTGGTLHISHSPYPTHAVYNRPETPNAYDKAHFNQAIDPEPPKMKPRGADIIIPTLKLTYTFRHPTAVVNELYAVALSRITGTVNDKQWRNFKSGEAMFFGADGSDGSSAEGEVSFHILCQENLQDLVIGGIEGIKKDGHDLLWVWWEPESVPGQASTKPKAVFIERVYRRIDFLTALGF